MTQYNYDATSLEITLRELLTKVSNGDDGMSALRFFQGTGIAKDNPFLAIMCGLIAVMIDDPSKHEEVIAFTEKYINENPQDPEAMVEDFQKIIKE